MDSELVEKLLSEPVSQANTIKEVYNKLYQDNPIDLFKILFILLRKERQAITKYVHYCGNRLNTELEQDPAHLIWSYFLNLGKEHHQQTKTLVTKWIKSKDIQESHVLKTALETVKGDYLYRR